MQELRLAWRAYACQLGPVKVYVGSAPQAQVAFAARALSPDEPWPIVGRARIAGQPVPLHLIRWPIAPPLALPIHDGPLAPGSPVPVMLSLSFAGPAADLYLAGFITPSVRSVADTGFVLLTHPARAWEHSLGAALRSFAEAPDLPSLAAAVTGLAVQASGPAAHGAKSGYPQ